MLVERTVCNSGLDQENLSCLAGWGGLSLAINIVLVDLRRFGGRSFVAVSRCWKLVFLWKRFLAK